MPEELNGDLKKKCICKF